MNKGEWDKGERVLGWGIIQFSSVQFSSVTQSCLTLCDHKNRSTNSLSSPRLTSMESVMPSSHLILCRPFLFLPPIPPRIRVFYSESTLRMRWPKYWSFSFSISPSSEHPGLIMNKDAVKSIWRCVDITTPITPFGQIPRSSGWIVR